MTKKLFTIVLLFAFIVLLTGGAFAANKTATVYSKESLNNLKTIKLNKQIPYYDQNVKMNHSKKIKLTNTDDYLFENFDTGAPGWKFEDLWSEPLWHIDATGAFSGNSYWTNFEGLGGYNDYVTGAMTTPPIDLAGTTAPVLSFQSDIAVEDPSTGVAGYDGWDGVSVMLSTDGTTWQVVNGSRPYDMQSSYGFHLSYGLNIPAWGSKTNGYKLETFDLTAFVGQTVWIRFVLSSDEATCTKDDPSLFGWRVDDIKVADGDNVIFLDDAGDTGTAAMNLIGPGGPNPTHFTTVAAVSAPNSVGLFDEATGNYLANMNAALVSPAIDLTALPDDAKALSASIRLKGVLDGTAYGTDGLNVDLFVPQWRTFSNGAWDWWDEFAFYGGIPADFATFEMDLSALIGVADSVQLRFAILTQPDGDVVTPANAFIDDFNMSFVATLPFDVAAVGAKGFQTAAVGKLLAPEVVIANIGLNPITGTLRWQASINDPDGNVVFPGMIGFQNVTDFAPGTTIAIPTFAGREWLVSAPGDYVFDITVVYANDGNPADNEISVPFTIWGEPFVEVLFQENFLPKAGENSLEDFGFTVVNGGGNEATGLNLNTWQHDAGLIYGQGGALLSWAWGNIDLGPDVTFPLDSSEVLDESLITPPIDISMLNPNATLFMQYYVYFRPAHPALGPPFGAQTSEFLIDFSIDGGETWYNAYQFVDDDGQPVDLGSRLPVHYYGADQPIPFSVYLGTDLTPALKMGGEMLHVRFTVKSENSYFIGCSIEDMVIYSGIGHANIVGVADIPQDQGKQVRVSWMAPFNEFKTYGGLYGEFETHYVSHYNLWRQVDETNFDFITTVPAHADKYYHFVAPTLQDGVDTYFMVSAHTNNPVIFTNSVPVAGMSTDDLAPNAPANLVAKPTDTTVELAWEAPTNEEARYFTIYRGTVSGSYDKQTNIVDLTFIDSEVTKGTTYYYTVTATDYAGNESEKSMEVNTVFTSVSESGSNIPTDYELAQNFPNPFNPTTSIKFSLPVAGHVTLKVMNIYGQEVATLVNETRAAGYHNVSWDASNVATGVYFYSIEAGNFKVTKKMILNK